MRYHHNSVPHWFLSPKLSPLAMGFWFACILNVVWTAFEKARFLRCSFQSR